MGLRLTADEFKGVSKRAPMLSTAGTDATIGTLQMTPKTKGMTAGGVSGALEKIGREQTKQETAGIVQQETQAAQMKLEAEQGAQQLKEDQDALQLRERVMQIEQEGMNLKSQLELFSQELSDKLILQQSQFDRDEIGRVFFNERQLADYTILQAKSQEDFATWAQNMQLLHSRRMQMLQAAHAKIVQTLEQEYQRGQQASNQDAQRALALTKAAIEKKIRDEQAKAQETAALWESGGALAGAAVAAWINPALAPLGGQMGAAAGKIVEKVTSIFD